MSSVKAAKSSTWKEVVELGQKLTSELEVGGSFDTLSNWMAHRIAELIQKEKSEKNITKREAVRSECADLIIKVWKTRRGEKMNDPLAALSQKITRVIELLSHYESIFNTPRESIKKTVPRNFGELLVELKKISRLEEKLHMAGILNSLPKYPEVMTLDKQEVEQAEKNKKDLETLTQIRANILADRSREFGNTKFTSTSKRTINSAIREELKRLNEIKQKFIQKL